MCKLHRAYIYGISTTEIDKESEIWDDEGGGVNDRR